MRLFGLIFGRRSPLNRRLKISLPEKARSFHQAIRFEALIMGKSYPRGC
jgi:hypothetical protein